MSIPTYDKLLLPVLEKMNDNKNYKRVQIKKLLKDKLQKDFKLTNEEMNETGKSGNINKLENRIGWAFTFLNKAEYIEKSTMEKFGYHITDFGKQALNDVKNNNKILDEKYLKLNAPNYLKNWELKNTKKDILNNKNDLELENNNEEFDLENTLEEMRQEIEIDFISKLREMEWQFFEDFCAELIQKMNYGVASKREIRVRDGGIDGIIYTDELGIKDKIYIQAKRYKDGNNVTVKDIKEFLYNITESGAKGIFITTSKFSSDAKSSAEKFQNGQIALIDDRKLIDLCFKYKHGIKVKQTIDLFEIDL